MPHYYSNGKLLLTGEYVVLDGALSLAVPTKFGQSLDIQTIDEPVINWKSFDENNKLWFEDIFKLNNGDVILKQVQHDDTSKRILQIFEVIKQLNPEFLNSKRGYNFTTQMDFPRHWGLGTSSTLINNIAKWGNIDPYKLLELTFGGSGYDIACAQHTTPITYQLKNKTPFVKPVAFNPVFKEHLYFVYLNKKQNSREGIAHYRKQDHGQINSVADKINAITLQMINCSSLTSFENLINEHEMIIGKITNQKPVKERLFNDFKGSIKSLGAWGGDFVLAVSKHNPTPYFKSKGYDTIISYSEMVL